MDKIEQAAEKLTRDEYRVLVRYAAGESASGIALNAQLDPGMVALTLDAVAGNNRGLAKNIATAWARRNGSQPLSSRPTPVVAARDVPVAPEPAAPASIERLLEEAAKSGSSRIERAAEKITVLVGELRELHEEFQLQDSLRQEQEALQKRLAEIKQELGRGQRSGAPVPAAAAGDSKAIRAWAAANGVACPPLGRVPTRVREAYDQAHPGGESTS